jgi:tight adherence protein B
MSALLVTVLAFVAGFLAIFSINLVLTDLFQRDLQQIRRRMEMEEYERERERARQSVQTQQTRLSDLAQEAFRESMERKTRGERLDDLLEQAGLRISPARLLAMAAGAAAVTAGLGWLLTGGRWQGALAAVVGIAVPLLYVQSKRHQRLEKLRGQLPDALELMSRTMRAGQTITQAMHAVSQEFKAPIATEFGYCYEQQNLGLSPEIALRDLARRTGLLEIKIFVLGLLVHRQTGGNLAQLLDNLSTIIRERFKLRGKVKALTAEGRLQAIMLLALPPIMFVLLLIVNRTYAMKHFDHPQLLAGTLVSMTLGAVFIRKIVNFDF